MRENKVIALSEPTLEPPTSAGLGRFPAMGHQDDEIDLMALVGTLWRGKWWISLFVMLALLIGGYYAYRVAVPFYTTTATVALNPQQQNVTDLTSVMSGLSGDQATINTEIEVFRSRGLIEKLVLKLNLSDDPEFNERLFPENPYAVKPFIKKVLGLQTPPTKPSDRAILDATIDKVLDSVLVSNKRQSYVFNVTATTTSPTKSALMSNTLADLYILDQLDVKFKATQQAATWLTERVAELKVKLENAVTQVKNFDSQAELVSPEGLAALQRQVKETRDRMKNSKEDLTKEKERIDALAVAVTSGDIDQITLLADDRNLNRIAGMVSSGTVHRDTFDAAVETLLRRANIDFERASGQVLDLKESITKLERKIDRQAADLVQLQQLQQEAAASQTIYDYFLKRLKETTVQQGIQKADSRVLSLAVVPTVASAPRKTLVLALSMTLGLLAGAGLVLFREMIQNGFRTAEELELTTGYTVMGQIPKMPVNRRIDALAYLVSKPTSAAAESVRNLRTSVLLSDVDHPPQVIMSTSSVPGEGKTTASLALAQNLAGLGKNVLLAEGDIRRRTFTNYFDIKSTNGILSVISGDTRIEDVIHRDEKLGFDILMGEKSSTNAADVFSSKKFHQFLKDIRTTYDYIVIDTPPVLVVPDARVIAQSVDAVLYSVKWDATPKSQVLQGLRMFETVNREVTGLVLAQIDPKGLKRYGYGGYDAKGYYDS